jgi:hypothetical protein
MTSILLKLFSDTKLCGVWLDYNIKIEPPASMPIFGTSAVCPLCSSPLVSYCYPIHLSSLTYMVPRNALKVPGAVWRRWALSLVSSIAYFGFASSSPVLATIRGSNANSGEEFEGKFEGEMVLLLRYRGHAAVLAY